MEKQQLKFCGPNSEKYDDLNNYSIVLKLTFGEVSIMLTGDAEQLAEKEIINTKEDLQADILKVGHHGSSSSTSDKFLKSVNPQYAVISVGKDNSYKHPSDKVIQRLEKYGVKIYRTDNNGTITMITDGSNIEFK